MARMGELGPWVWRGARQLLPAVRAVGEQVGAGDAPAGDERASPDDALRRCAASGWRVRLACTDGEGRFTCPLCGQRTRTHPDVAVGHGVRVVHEHGARERAADEHDVNSGGIHHDR